MSGAGGEREGRGVDYYALLGVPPGASGGAIRAAFRRLAKRWHPDTSQVVGTAERFRQIVEAYDVLSDPARRLAYDARHGGGMGGTYGPAGAYAAYGAEVAGAPHPHPHAAPEPIAPRAPRRAAPAPTRQRPSRPTPGPAAPVAPISAIGAVSAVSAGARTRRAAAIGGATAAKAACVECGAPAVGNTDRCAACLRKYGTFREHLARAAERAAGRIKR